jgi:GNAT superfamily N-acetyltransferase
MGDASVRLATVDDIDALRVVYRRASLSNEGDLPFLWAHPELLELDDRAVHDGRTIAATQDDLVVGFATVSVATTHVELDALFVDPDHRRAGHAIRLVRAVVDTARRASVPRVEVSANEHARDFYDAAGFEQVGVTAVQSGLVPRMHLAV